MDGEGTIAAKTRPRKRSTTEVAPAATEMRTAAEMPAAMAAEMAATVKMPSAVTATVATSPVTPAVSTAAAFRGRIASGRQRGRKNKNSNSEIELWHRTLRGHGHLNLNQRECDDAVPDYACGNRAAVASKGSSSPFARYDTVR
jgi:hypothetical protein